MHFKNGCELNMCISKTVAGVVKELNMCISRMVAGVVKE